MGLPSPGLDRVASLRAAPSVVWNRHSTRPRTCGCRIGGSSGLALVAEIRRSGPCSRVGQPSHWMIRPGSWRDAACRSALALHRGRMGRRAPAAQAFSKGHSQTQCHLGEWWRTARVRADARPRVAIVFLWVKPRAASAIFDRRSRAGDFTGERELKSLQIGTLRAVSKIARGRLGSSRVRIPPPPPSAQVETLGPATGAAASGVRDPETPSGGRLLKSRMHTISVSSSIVEPVWLAVAFFAGRTQRQAKSASV